MFKMIEKSELISFIDVGGGIKGTKPIAVLPKEYMDNIGAKTDIIGLSSDTLQKNTVNHPEITTRDYLNLQSILDSAQLVVQDSKNTLVFIETGDRSYHAAIKATRTGEGIFMTSLRLTGEKDIREFKRKGIVVKG